MHGGWFGDLIMPIEETENEIRARIIEPEKFEADSFKRITIKEDKPRVYAIIGKLKGEPNTTIQAYRFPKEDGWTIESARKWVNEHKEKKSMAKFYTTTVGKEFNDDEKSLVAWASKSVVDRDGELILPGAWDLGAFTSNPVILLSHDYKQLPVGKALWTKQEKDGLKFKVKFASTPNGEEAYQLFKEGILNAFSVGFIPKEDDTGDIARKHNAKRVYKKVELLEISVVSVPSCPAALVERANSGMVTKDFQDVVNKIVAEKANEKAMTHNSEMHDGEPDWASVDKTKLPRMAFADMGEEDKKSTWKFPHHYVVNGSINEETGVYEGGDMYLHKGGLMAAYAAAMGARSGEQAGDEIIDHLNRHREAMGMGEENKSVGIDSITKAVNKTTDEFGNPSAKDIKEAIEAKMNKPINGPYSVMQYKFYVEDLYPINYPDGHCVVEIYNMASGSTDEYWRYEYRYNNGDPEIMGGIRMEETYKPKQDLANMERAISSLSIATKAGAVLSASNRERVQRFREAAAQAVSTADELLSIANPDKEKKSLDNIPDSRVKITSLAEELRKAFGGGIIREAVKEELARITGRIS